MHSSDETRWRAVQSRAASHTFVYAVKTTKIFCRPDCPARLARRANVAFFDTAKDARTAGFRACKRCKPDLQATSTSASPTDGSTLAPGEQNARRRAAAKAKTVIEAAQGTMNWKEVAEIVGLSQRYLFDAFKAVEGMTPGAFAKQLQQEQREVSTQDFTKKKLSEVTAVAVTKYNVPVDSDDPRARPRNTIAGHSISQPRETADLEPCARACKIPLDSPVNTWTDSAELDAFVDQLLCADSHMLYGTDGRMKHSSAHFDGLSSESLGECSTLLTPYSGFAVSPSPLACNNSNTLMHEQAGTPTILDADARLLTVDSTDWDWLNLEHVDEGSDWITFAYV